MRNPALTSTTPDDAAAQISELLRHPSYDDDSSRQVADYLLSIRDAMLTADTDAVDMFLLANCQGIGLPE